MSTLTEGWSTPPDEEGVMLQFELVNCPPSMRQSENEHYGLMPSSRPTQGGLRLAGPIYSSRGNPVISRMYQATQHDCSPQRQ